MFKLSTVGTCSAQLQITNKFKPINGEDYDVNIYSCRKILTTTLIYLFCSLP